MKKLLNIPILAIIAIALTFTACDEDNENDIVPAVEYPSLKVVNEKSGTFIYAVRLNGYEFTYLNIDSGSSQTFALDKGMSGGYEDINIIVSYNDGYRNRVAGIAVNFYKGETTTVTL